MATELMLYGDIGSDWWSSDGITEELVFSELKNLDQTAAKHKVHINSPGGRVDTGLAIMNLLRSHKDQMKAINSAFELETICDGYAMSIASVIFMAGDIRTIALGGILMIHEAWNGCYGNAAEMRKMADTLDQHSQNIANVYATLSVPSDDKDVVRDAEYYRTLMKAETYMISDDAVKKGLATGLDTGLTASIDKSLTPETMQGRYVQLMSAGYKKRTFTKPTAAASLTSAKLAKQRLDILLAATH